MALKVAIIGAGIGGLSTAIALRRAGHQVDVYEKSHFQNEVGAAITITPNGMRVLDNWGFDDEAARAVEGKQMRMVDPQSLQDVVVESFREVPSDYGSRFMFFHRVDLHTALKEMAVSKDSQPGVPVTIHNGHSVASVDCEGGSITLEDGTTVQRDLIVIADGIHTKFINTLTGHDEPLVDTGSSFYRCLIPTDEITKDSDLASLWKNQDPGFWVPFDLSTGFYLVCYPCRDGSMMNIALRHKTHKKNEGADDWNTETTLEDVKELVKGRNSLLEKLVGMTSSVSVHKIFRREPLGRYSNGRAVIIGDAAHPIAPTHAQGAVLAIQEAAALEVLFTNLNDASQVPDRLRLYDDLMKRRIHVCHLLSDAMPGRPDQYRDRAEKLWEGEMYPYTAMNFSKPVRDFFYAYDVHEDAKQFLEKPAQ